MDTKGLLIVLTGKTASGKDTVMHKLLGKLSGFKRVITTTSRGIRSGERDGVDYYFISEEEFLRKIDQGDFIEYVGYGGNFYGTEKEQIKNNLNGNLIWRIDPSRAGQIRQFIRDSFELPQADELLKKVLVIYLTIPDELIRKRLKRRNLRADEIQKRMQDDIKFWHEYKDSYDFVVENVDGKLDETVEKICRIIVSANPPL